MGKSKKFAIIDVETTGGNFRSDRITEIGIAIHNGEKVIDRFETLLNPEISIPPFIQKLTGITNEMVEDAPKFFEVARKIVELTESCIFVAHNVKFDYLFIRNEFERLGYSYNKKQLCTKQLSKKLFPEIGKYSLGALIAYFNINVSARHRAMADVEATVIVFENLLKADTQQSEFNLLINNGIKLSKLPSNLTIEDLHKIPETCGIYYFFGENDHLLYVGKSKNIQKRVMQHFSKPTTKSNKIISRTHRIDYEETGSEILAIILEDSEIKTKTPEFNITQRKSKKLYGLLMDPHWEKPDENVRFIIQPLNGEDASIYAKVYKNKRSAKSHITKLLEEYELHGHHEIIHSGDRILVKAANESSEKIIVQKIETESKLEVLKNDLNSRKNFNYLVIDSSFSNSEYSVFIFKQGILKKMGKLENGEAFTSENHGYLDDISIPINLNDYLIKFILKRKKKYILKEL
ncbi:exonuclease domain-containing protein [Membranihabitans maritimus]|uniref:exonuclease domain-containing protein n=1 Tax=Membranihabitans maritimus TaxID=2904244 RepID=UPI001F42374F|nr:exonuclease domain-containing protein [Membranihabitans maritimus]